LKTQNKGDIIVVEESRRLRELGNWNGEVLHVTYSYIEGFSFINSTNNNFLK